MYATVRRYEGIDESRSGLPDRRGRRSADPSVLLFDTAEQAHESTRVAARRIREQKLEAALPNMPKVTAGGVIAHLQNGAGVSIRRGEGGER
jgi:hypothetical protein